MRRSLDPRAMSLWLVCGLIVALVTSDTGVRLALIGAAISVAIAGKDLRVFRMFLLIGAFTLLTRTTLFALATAFDGRAVAVGLVEGVSLLAIMSIFGAFMSNIETSQLLRLVPRSMFEAGLVLNIALSFAPRLSTTANDVIDAHRMRGAQSRKTAVVSSAIPMLATALDRSINLAEAMDSRGYGFTQPIKHRMHWRNAAALAATISAMAAALWSLDKAPAVWGPVAAGSACVAFYSMHRIAKLVGRTRYRRSTLGKSDWCIAIASIAATGLIFLEPEHLVTVPVATSYLAVALLSLPAWLSLIEPSGQVPEVSR